MRKELCLTLLLLTSCSGVPLLPNLTPYKVDIQQGNYVTQDMVSKLKPGMTRSQVRFIMGTPLVADPFHADRWDYVYRMAKRGELKESRHISLVFAEDKLARIEGDVVPAPGAKADDAADGRRSASQEPAPAAAGDAVKPQ